jgi:probable blue pigment (indigoidine) exporter
LRAAAPDVLASTSWQPRAGGRALVLVTLAAEGAPPVRSGSAVAAFAFVSLVATALAFPCWFAGLAHLDRGQSGCWACSTR